MIRSTLPEDTVELIDLAASTGVFKPLELVALREVLDDYHAANRAEGHVAITFERAGTILGFAYYAPAAMTEGTWYLYWIAVRKDTHARGIGSELLVHAENDLRRRGARVLFIETSSMPHYELTRRFYRKHGYDHEATLRDFYAPGDGMVVFRKLLENENPRPASGTAAPPLL